MLCKLLASGMRFEYRSPTPWQGAEGGLIGLLQRDWHIVVWLDVERHVRKHVADGNRFNVRPRRQIALVGSQRQRLVIRQHERYRLNLGPDQCMNAVRVARARRKWINNQQVNPVFKQLTRFGNKSA